MKEACGVDEINALVKEHYGLTVLTAEDVGSRTVLATDRGTYYLYSCPAGYRYKRRFMEKVQKHFQKNTDYAFLPVSKTGKGEAYVIDGDELFFLQLGVREWHPQQPARALGQALAKFHKGTASFTGEKIYYPYRSLGNWPAMWRKKLRQYSGFRDEWELAERGDITPFDEYMLTSYTYVHHLGDLAVEYLIDSGYSKVIKETANHGKIAYQNFDDGYMLFADDGKRYLAGEWNWVIDMRVRDIGQWIKAEVRKEGWNEEKISQFLDGYNSVSPLLNEEYGVIFAMLMYPGRFLKFAESFRSLSAEDRAGADFSDWQTMLDDELYNIESGLRQYPKLVTTRYGATLSPIEWLWRTIDEETDRIYDEARSS